ncbi:hypothetical protein [Bacteroides eggerthii]|jgi:hypothetical protein|uniref:hypothetical protein n=1 Tax=Bacteroides eggerthii TaxID=28111 RepID=UPI002097E504|nr:hypothetical protein [Bacteroides eggerthii]MCO7158867.1 hypothetical protein [Bacteroides eggerthii]
MIYNFNKKEREYVPITLSFFNTIIFMVVKMYLSLQTDVYNWFIKDYVSTSKFSIHKSILKWSNFTQKNSVSEFRFLFKKGERSTFHKVLFLKSKQTKSSEFLKSGLYAERTPFVKSIRTQLFFPITEPGDPETVILLF